MIKYYDMEARAKFDDNGLPKNNWNENGEYGDKYAAVSFYTDSDAYGDTIPFWRTPPINALMEERDSLLSGIGWKRPSSERIAENSYTVMRRDEEVLYLQPRMLTGVVKMTKIKETAEALEGAKTFTLICVCLYKRFQNIPDREYDMPLSVKHSEIERELYLAAYSSGKTMRSRYDVIMYVADTVRVPRVHDALYLGPSEQDVKAVSEILDEMTEKGYIIEKDGMLKSASKSALQKMGVKI